jgi:hypothetical protein
MKQFFGLLFLFSFLASVRGILDSQPVLEVKLNQPAENSFQIFINHELWFESNEVFITQSSKVYSTKDQSLALSSYTSNRKNDKLGSYQEHVFQYVKSVNNETLFTGFIKLYSNFILFEQFFPEQLSDTSMGNADKVTTGFPTFQIADSHSGAGFAHWVSWFYTDASVQQAVVDAKRRRALVAPGFATPLFGKWDSQTNILGGVGGTGVTAVFDEKGQTTVILSAFENPMVINHDNPFPGVIHYGLMGNVTSIPKGFSVQSILFVDNNGVNSAMRGWGNVLRSFYNKPLSSEAKKKDMTLQYLGFTTDNGAYYYYHTEPNATYEDTLISVSNYAKEQQIPYKYILLDSFWYFKGANGGVSKWEEQPELFPNKLDYLYQQTGWKIQAHNRYWAYDNLYAKTQGGAYDFVEDPVKNGAVPVDPAFWIDLLSHPAKDWGLVVYEQDWLFNEFYEYVSQMMEDVHLGRLWLTQMAAGAKANGVNIQYCMPFIRHLLQSVEFDIVTQARASDDYLTAPYGDGYTSPNWRIGGQNLLIDSLGMRPSKDGYWSTSYQSGNPYSEERYEPNPRIQAVSAILSGGPVQIADGIGYSDVSLILKSCMSNGRLLHPSVPATLIDAAFAEAALQSGVGPDGDIWFAPSVLSSQRYGSLFVAELKKDWSIVPSQVGLTKSGQVYYLRENAMTENTVVRWSENEPLTLKVRKLFLIPLPLFFS